LNARATQQLFKAACSAQEKNHFKVAVKKFRALLDVIPSHLEARYRLAAILFQGGDAKSAAVELQTLVKLSPDTLEFRFRSAHVLSELGDTVAAAAELLEAVRLDPANIVLQLQHGALCLKTGDEEGALSSFQRALTMAPQLDTYASDPRVPAPLAETMRTALSSLGKMRSEFTDATLAAVTDAYPQTDVSRLRQACEECGSPSGNGDQHQPTLLYLPGIPSRGWYERDMLPWIDEVEAMYPDIQAELDALVRDEAPFEPYIPAASAGTSSGSKLVGSMNWNSYRFYADGKAFTAHSEACPTTASVIDRVPTPYIRRHSPEMFFSRLRPKTQIEPHFGKMNVRLTVHLALTIPSDCGIKVGGETRGWTPGQVLAFDDSIKHEAWNDSDDERIVLIFEAWNPDVSEVERFGIEQFFEHRMAWLERFDNDPLLPPIGTQPRMEWE